LNILPSVSRQVLPAKRFGLRQLTVSDAARQAEGRLSADRIFLGRRVFVEASWPAGFGLMLFPRVVESTAVG
jgi:hypothetical protein